MAEEDLRLEQFRGRSERLVGSELYANSTLAALKRLFANGSERDTRAEPDGHGRPAQQANFGHVLHTVARNMEGMFLQHTALKSTVVQRIVEAPYAVARAARGIRPASRRIAN